MVSRPGLYTADRPDRGDRPVRRLYAICSRAIASPISCPTSEKAVQAAHRLDAKLTGANPIDVLIQIPKGKSLYDPDTLDVIASVHRIDREDCRRRQCLVAADLARLARREGAPQPTRRR